MIFLFLNIKQFYTLSFSGRLHTKLYKFGYNISPNISRAKNRTDLKFCKNVYMCDLFTPLDS